MIIPEALELAKLQRTNMSEKTMTEIKIETPKPQPDKSCHKLSQKHTRQKHKKKRKLVLKDIYKLNGRSDAVFKKKQFLETLGDQAFNVSFACKQIGIHRRSYFRWRKDDKEFNRACEDIQDEILDLSEVRLQSHIQKGNLTALLYFLKTKGQERGYTETVKNINEHSGSIQSPVGINFILQPDPKYEKEKEERDKLFARKTKEENKDVPKSDVSDQEKPNDTSQDPIK